MIQLLKSKSFALYSSVLLIVGVQTPISAEVINQFGTGEYSMLFAIIKALALEIAILYFALNQKRWPTVLAMTAIATINARYYNLSFESLDAVGVVLTIMPPLLVFLISEMAADHIPKPKVAKFVPLHLRDKPVAKPKVNATPKPDVKQKAIMRVQQGESISEVARTIGKNKSTVSRWVASL